MKEFVVEHSANTNTFDVICLTYPTPGSFKGEIVFKSSSFETANTVCDSHILDADPAYQEWLLQQDSEFA